jgi:hypothetical protein
MSAVYTVVSADGTMIGYGQIGSSLILLHGGIWETRHYPRLAKALEGSGA